MALSLRSAPWICARTSPHRSNWKNTNANRDRPSSAVTDRTAWGLLRILARVLNRSYAYSPTSPYCDLPSAANTWKPYRR